ncbi:MAG: hypothetical protein HQL97_16870 [Magnetococcales bacterium]|nr:hypothetical protein [Magnetococcales bacterium]
MKNKERASNPKNAWVMLLSNGYVNHTPKNLTSHAWPVRRGGGGGNPLFLV